MSMMLIVITVWFEHANIHIMLINSGLNFMLGAVIAVLLHILEVFKKTVELHYVLGICVFLAILSTCISVFCYYKKFVNRLQIKR